MAAGTSHCRCCARTLAWWENIPLLSWLALRGRCRTCHTRIGWRYPLVEAVVALLWAVAVAGALPAEEQLLVAQPIALLPLLFVAAGQMCFFWLLVALAVLDAENLWLPDKLTIPGAVIGVLYAAAAPVLLRVADAQPGLPLAGSAPDSVWSLGASRLVAALVVAACVLLVRWLYGLVRRREGLGMGDAKLMALLGAWLGLPGAALAFVLAVTLGTVCALWLLVCAGGRTSQASSGQVTEAVSSSPSAWASAQLPLGTFLCVGGVLSALFGRAWIDLYLRFFGL